MPTIYDIAREVPIGRGGRNGVAPRLSSLVEPESFDARPGMQTLTPEQMASLEVPLVTRNGQAFSGYQRPHLNAQIRAIKSALDREEPMPVLEVAYLPDGRVVLTDGQHRVLAAIWVGVPLEAVFRRMSERQARKLFSNQTKARRVNPNITVLSGDDPFSEYVQDAVTSDNHVWSGLVGQAPSAGRLSPNQMFNAIRSYVWSRRGSYGRSLADDTARFDEALCDELGELLLAFGTKRTNPTAFRPVALRALTDTAILVVRRNGSQPDDIERWKRHMPKFAFDEYRHFNKGVVLVDMLLAHWNKRLSPDRRIARPGDDRA